MPSSQILWLDKHRIPPGNWPFLRVIRTALGHLRESLKDSIDLTSGQGQVTISGCLGAYRQAVLCRVLDLAQGLVAAWNAGQLIGAVVCARSLLETIACFHSFMKRAEAAASAREWGMIGKLVDAYAFSTSSEPPEKRKRTPQQPPRVGRMVTDFITSTQPGQEQFWHQICDTSHPNGRRMMSIAGDLRERRFDARRLADNEELLFVPVFNCLYSCCWLYSSMLEFDILIEQLRSGGPLPADHSLMKEKVLLDTVTAKVSSETGGKMKVGPIEKPRR